MKYLFSLIRWMLFQWEKKNTAWLGWALSENPQRKYERYILLSFCSIKHFYQKDFHNLLFNGVNDHLAAAKAASYYSLV